MLACGAGGTHHTIFPFRLFDALRCGKWAGAHVGGSSSAAYQAGVNEKQAKRLRRLILATQSGELGAVETLRDFVRVFEVSPRQLTRAFQVCKRTAQRRLGTA